MSTGSKLLLIGLRGSGKTSYLAALWHLLETGEAKTSLSVPELQPDREYLNRIRSAWLKFEEVGRTSLRGHETVTLCLRDLETSTSVEVAIPDVSGESLRLQWALRRAKSNYAEIMKAASGVLLFVHPTRIKKTRVLSATDQPESDAREKIGGPSSKILEWSPEFTSTQVQLVALLQFANWLRDENRRARVAVVVSAWDLIQEPILPSFWLERRLPLLQQYLVANEDVLPFRTYGISALGGDLTKDVDQLRSESTPSHRIRVVQERMESDNDLTAPIKFLLALGSDN